MFELLFCSLLTIFPDYLYRRYVQGKRIGREITLYSVWYELRYGIVTCLMLTLSLITMIFYFHPTAVSAVAAFRTMPILPEGSGRVAEIYVSNALEVRIKAGDRIFRLDDESQKADVEIARRQVAETEAEIELARSERAVAAAQVGQAQAALAQAVDELNTKRELQARNAGVVTEREVERLQTAADGRQAGLDAAEANLGVIDTRISVALPARLESARARLDNAEIALAKTVVYAGVDGTIQQFTLRVGDIVNPLMRPAGILVPDNTRHARIVAGFGQIEAQVLKPGMITEVVCSSVPFTVIPMVITEVQTNIASGQLAMSDRLFDAARDIGPSTITTVMEPLYAGGLDKVPPGSQCAANAYTSNHERLSSGEPMGTGEFLFLHAVDAVGVVHAAILRAQALLFPVRNLVLSGH